MEPQQTGPVADTDPVGDAVDAAAAAPPWQFTPAPEPAVFEGGLGDPPPADDPPAEGGAGAGELEPPDGAAAGASTESSSPADVAASAEAIPSFEPDLADHDAHDADAVAHDGGGGEPEAAGVTQPASEEAPPAAAPGFVAPRAGFHIVEDAPVHRTMEHDEVRLEMPAFTADEQPQTPADPVVEQVPAAPTDADFRTWRSAGPAADPAPPEDAPSPIQVPSSPPPAFVDEEEDEIDAEQRGWGVRRHGEPRARRPGAHSVASPPIEDDPFENNTRLSDIRRRIEERLRKKRCDEAAALLQELAQETGGRAVAELAMNAGDRCRALGKSNAALNCYLAAARSDPVYELPLSRLADICIDNQDTELAVSYLERIARLYRYRGDDKAAIRVYRRIATIAPYREDILTLLMNAQRTGQLE